MEMVKRGESLSPSCCVPISDTAVLTFLEVEAMEITEAGMSRTCQTNTQPEVVVMVVELGVGGGERMEKTMGLGSGWKR